ncbi:MAG: ABC transporter permease [Terriglobia bacterium]
MSSISAVFYREGKIRFTNLVWVFFDLFYPLAYFLLFGVGMNYAFGQALPRLETDYNAFFLAGAVGMANFGIATNTAWGFFNDRDTHIFYEMLAYPLSRGRLLVGKVVFNALLAVVQAAITLALAVFVLRVPIALPLLPLFFLGVVGFTVGWFFFFAIFALKIRRNDVFNTIINVIYFVSLFVSSIFYPLQLLPDWFRWAALANPLTWHVDFLRLTSIGVGVPGEILLECALFVLFSLASFAYAVRCLQEQS